MVWSWIDRFFSGGEQHLDLARIQWAEREERRARMELELSGKDAQDCVERVKKRMRLGDSVWMPPMYARSEAYRVWRRKHRRSQGIVLSMEESCG